MVIPDDHDYNESETRNRYIDLLLREAGWPLTEARDREFEVLGMPSGTGVGYVDYVFTAGAHLDYGKTTIDVIGSAANKSPGSTTIVITRPRPGGGAMSAKPEVTDCGGVCRFVGIAVSEAGDLAVLAGFVRPVGVGLRA